MGEHWLIVGVTEVSFYIENPRWFWNSVNSDYNIKSYSK